MLSHRLELLWRGIRVRLAAAYDVLHVGARVFTVFVASDVVLTLAGLVGEGIHEPPSDPIGHLRVVAPIVNHGARWDSAHARADAESAVATRAAEMCCIALSSRPLAKAASG